MRPADHEAGFTLVEVLVALVVSALLIGVIMSGALTAREREKRAEERARALSLGRELVARAVVDGDGDNSGNAKGMRWSREWQVQASDARGMVRMMRITVEVSSQRGNRLLRLETYRLVSMVST